MKRRLVLALTTICCVLALSACDLNNTSHIHDYTTIQYNENAHWLECSCKDKAAVEFHKGGTATSTQRAKCSVCNAEYGEIIHEELYYGEYGLGYIEVFDGQSTQTFHIGEYYFGTTLQTSTISATMKEGQDSITFDFGYPVSVACDIVVEGDSTAIAYLDSQVDLFNNGNPTNVLYFDIVDVNGQKGFCLKANGYLPQAY
jgi:hypothetical protein